jgi:uncharacterized protein YprB with RNaseH-like and TPR domain
MASHPDKFSRLAALRPARPAVLKPAALRAPEEDDVFARLIGAGLGKNDFGEHLSLRNWYSTPEFTEPFPVSLELLSRHRDETISRKTLAALQHPERWLFLDTETTGLSGGTGTYAFLIGIAWWDSGGLQVEQFFMRNFGDEHSILHEISERLEQRPVLVTFNGKSFDWPLLESRFAMTRTIAVPRLAAHLDLLHPARALWKLRLGSVRLVELESHVLDTQRLGWHRRDDISSSMIPQYYFDYLRGGSPLPLVGVAKHNQMDLRGLAALFGKINELLAAEHTARHEIDSLDLFGLSRFLQRRGDSSRAHSACEQALDLGLPAEFRTRARRELAQLAKQKGDHARAAELWQEIVADPQDGIHACEQLAIYYERRAKDPAKALKFAKLALGYIRRPHTQGRDYLAAAKFARLEKNILKRIARLQQRLLSSPVFSLEAHQ